MEVRHLVLVLVMLLILAPEKKNLQNVVHNKLVNPSDPPKFVINKP